MIITLLIIIAIALICGKEFAGAIVVLSFYLAAAGAILFAVVLALSMAFG